MYPALTPILPVGISLLTCSARAYFGLGKRVKIQAKYVLEDVDRHGNVRLYFRKPGLPEIRLPAPSGSPDFWASYHKAAASAPLPKPQNGAALPGSMRWLMGEYFKTPAFLKLGPKTRKVRRGLLERFCDHVQEGSAVTDGDRAFAGMRAKHVLEHRDRLAKTPAMATALVKALRVLFAFAIRYDHHDRNPAADVEVLKGSAEGWHRWTLTEIDQYEARHPVGTTARLALALALYTGQRRADLAILGRQHERN